jgi:hypothetical protein
MKNVKNFNEFLNEGIFSLKPKSEKDEILENIYKDVKNNFDYFDFDVSQSPLKISSSYKSYDITYNTIVKDVLKVNTLNHIGMYINGEYVENSKYITKICNFLTDKYKDIENNKYNKSISDKDSEFVNKYRNKKR